MIPFSEQRGVPLVAQCGWKLTWNEVVGVMGVKMFVRVTHVPRMHGAQSIVPRPSGLVVISDRPVTVAAMGVDCSDCKAGLFC